MPPFRPRLIQWARNRRKKCLCAISGPFGRPVVPDDSDSSSGVSPLEGKLRVACASRLLRATCRRRLPWRYPPPAHRRSRTARDRRRNAGQRAPFRRVHRQSIGKMTNPARADRRECSNAGRFAQSNADDRMGRQGFAEKYVAILSTRSTAHRSRATFRFRRWPRVRDVARVAGQRIGEVQHSRTPLDHENARQRDCRAIGWALSCPAKREGRSLRPRYHGPVGPR